MATDSIRARTTSRNIADTQPDEVSISQPPRTISTSMASTLQPLHKRTRQAATVLGLLAALPAAAASRLTPALAPAVAQTLAPSVAAAPETFAQGDGSAVASGIGSWGGNLFSPPHCLLGLCQFILAVISRSPLPPNIAMQQLLLTLALGWAWRWLDLPSLLWLPTICTGKRLHLCGLPRRRARMWSTAKPRCKTPAISNWVCAAEAQRWS